MEMFAETYIYRDRHVNYSFVIQLSLFNLRYLIFIIGNYVFCYILLKLITELSFICSIVMLIYLSS